MPYIQADRRGDISFDASRDAYPITHIAWNIKNAGELNYVITAIIKAYLKERETITQNPISYQQLNDIVGALECCKQEFYRRVVVPYEENKIAENGDVY